MNIDTDPDKKRVLTGQYDQINAFHLTDFQYTAIGKFIIFRLLEDRDVKVLITGKGKTTGTGKTTLAILLARWINQMRNDIFGVDYAWNAEGYSFMNVYEYLNSYKNAEPGDALITDELEYMADRRRHMSNQNVHFSQAWSILRYKNVITIGTAPSLSDLEKRVVETADIWINVVEKGKANVYYLTFDDFEWKSIFRRLRIGQYKESIQWDAIPKDSDYTWLKSQKEDLGVPGLSEKEDQLDEKDLSKREKEVRNSNVKQALLYFLNNDMMYPNGNVTQGDIADIMGVSQQQVSILKKEIEKE